MGYAVAAGSVMVVIVGLIGLWDVWRTRSKLTTWHLSVWILAIVLLPVFGVVAWLLYRISKAQAIIDGFDTAAGTLEPPDDHRTRAIPPSG